jgi:hypothetical protein
MGHLRQSLVQARIAVMSAVCAAQCLVGGSDVAGKGLAGFQTLQREAVADNVLSPADAAAGWVLLFDGRTLAGWEKSGDAPWSVEGGAIVTSGTASGYLRTARTFQGFELKAEFNADETMNSAIFVRCPVTGSVSPRTCYEVNIYDPHERFPTGSVNDVQSVLPDRPQTAGKWNSYEIALIGNHIQVKLNGKTTVDARDDRFQAGVIALQANGPGSRGGTIRFRNIKIRPR